MVETTVTRRPLRCTASTRARKSPSPENSTRWSTVCGHLQHVDGDLDVHVAAPALAALAVGELAGRLGHQGEAVVVQPVDQRPDRGILLVLGDGGVVIGPHQQAALAELVQQLAVVDVEAQGLGGGKEIGPVDEQRQALGRVEGHEIGILEKYA
jgi:hypothetical protein